MKQLDPSVYYINCLSESIDMKDIILVAAARPKKYKHSYDGTDPGYFSWLTKSYYDPQMKCLKLRDPDINSLLINHEQVN